MNVLGIYGHNLAGIFYFDVPIVLFLAFVFHGVVKKNLIDQLPLFLQQRFQEVRNFNFVEYFKHHKLIFIVSGIIGTVTHIVWDGFTHKKQYFVQHLPEIYEGRTFPILGVNEPLWYALQIISTIVGGLFIVVYVLMMKPQTGVFNKPRFSYWILLAVFMVLVLYIRMLFYKGTDLKYVIVVITICSSFCLGITILGLIPFKRREIRS
jgi:hypothetical protein